MREIVIARHGGPQVLRLEEREDPLPRAGEIRIRVRATGVNFADVLARMGLYPDAPDTPCVVGYEVAGVVDRVGEGVEEFREGDRVVSLTRFGGYADTVVVPAIQAMAIPEGKGFVEAAALPVNYLTAWICTERFGSILPGEKVLIHAAAGGVGLAALQLARRRGAVTYGTASPGKHERLRRAGLDHPIDYREKDFEEEIARLTDGRGVDLILDSLGGGNARKSYRCLAPMGRLFLFGVSSFSPGVRRNPLHAAVSLAQTPFFHAVPLMNQNKGVFGVNLGRLWSEGAKVRLMFEELVRLWAQGEIAPTIDSTYPLEEAGAAHLRLQERQNFGKVVLVVG